MRQSNYAQEHFINLATETTREKKTPSVEFSFLGGQKVQKSTRIQSAKNLIVAIDKKKIGGRWNKWPGIDRSQPNVFIGVKIGVDWPAPGLFG